MEAFLDFVEEDDHECQVVHVACLKLTRMTANLKPLILKINLMNSTASTSPNTPSAAWV